ncbi:MAG: thiamine pyrophosphate-dependent enzyme, partial [Acetobacteraceae bacterium]
GNPDFVAYARSYGASGVRIEETAALAPMLDAAFRAGGIHLVVAPIDYSENIRVLVEELGALPGNGASGQPELALRGDMR